MASINYTKVREGYVNPNRVRLDAYYQRDAEESNIKTIQRSIREMGGFDDSRPIIVNTNWQAVDGGQRARASVKENLKRVRYIMYDFVTPDDEAKYFDISNEPTKSLTARDALYSKYARPTAPNEYAVLVYTICNDPSCLLSGGHDLKMMPGHKPSNDLIKVENVCYIVNNLVLGERSGFSKKRAFQLAQKAKIVFQSKYGVANAIDTINTFLQFYFTAFGWNTQKNELKFREAFLRGALELFYDVLRTHPNFKPSPQKIGKRLQNFQLTVEATKNHKQVIQQELRRHINGRIKKESNLI